MSAESASKSYQLTLSDKKAVVNAAQYAENYSKELADIKEYFLQKGWIGLWWDHIGFFGSSDTTEVSKDLEEFRKLARKLIDVTKKVEEGNSDSYDILLKFYNELKDKEVDANRGLKESKSKTLVKMYRDFLLQVKYEMERKLGSVECVAQRIIINDLKNGVQELKLKHEKDANEHRKQYETLKEQNEQLQTLIKEGQEKAENLGKALDEMKSSKKVLQTIMEQGMDKINKVSDQRCEALHQENEQLREMFKESIKKADERSEVLFEENQNIKRMLEESQKKTDERILRLIQIISDKQN